MDEKCAYAERGHVRHSVEGNELIYTFLMKYNLIQAIDVHGHYGLFPHANKLLEQFSSADAAGVSARAADCGVEWSIL